MFPYEGLLPVILAQQALGNYVGYVFTDNSYLLKTVFDPAQSFSHKLKARAVENGFLHTRHETKPGEPANLPDFSQEV